MIPPPAPPPPAEKAPASARPRPTRVVWAGLLVVFLIVATLTTFWYVTGTGPFASIQTSQWAYDLTDATGLQAQYTGAGVLVCIVDTGIDVGHPDLQGVAVVAWHDYVNGRAQPYDDEGHGTAMAGIIFARGRIHGLAPGARLIAVKAIASTGSGTDAQVAAAIDFCTNNGAHVISLSLGGGPHPIFGDASQSKDAVLRAMAAGIVVVAAAGNDGQSDDGDVESPASVTGVIAVGAVDRTGVLAPFSSIGSSTGGFPPVARFDPNRKPEVVAPGVEIATLLNGGRYAYVSGTSPAAALVSGIVALLLEKHPSYRHDATRLSAFKTAVMDGARPAAGQQTPHDPHYGYGIVQGLGTDAHMPP